MEGEKKEESGPPDYILSLKQLRAPAAGIVNFRRKFNPSMPFDLTDLELVQAWLRKWAETSYTAHFALSCDECRLSLIDPNAAPSMLFFSLQNANRARTAVACGSPTCQEAVGMAHRKAIENVCYVCDAEINTQRTCGKCHKRRYCGVECQKTDWPIHKFNCGKK